MISTGQKLLTFDAVVQIQGKGKRPTISGLVYSGGFLSLENWSAPVLIDLEGLTIADSIPLLIDHRNTLDATAGQVTVTNDGRELTIEGFLNTSEAAGKILQLSRDEQTLHASVGVEPDSGAVEYLDPNTEFSANGQQFVADKHLGAYMVHAGELREVSIVSVAADPQTNLRIAARLKTGVSRMFTRTKNTDITDTLTAERDRCAAITGTCDSYGSLISTEAMTEIRAKALGEGLALGQLNALILDTASIEGQRSKIAAQYTMPNIPGGRGADVSRRDVLAAATLTLVGRGDVAEKSYDARTLETARALNITAGLDLFKHAATFEGRPFDGGGSTQLIEAGFSTASLPVALGDAMHRTIADAYRSTPSNYDAIATRRPVKDFRTHNMLRPYLDGGEFEPVGPTGELKYAAISEENFPHKATTRGKIFSVDRTTIINDDLGLIFDLQRQLGQNAKRTVQSIFWSTIRDADTFFSSDNGNFLAGADTALNIISLGAAILAMRSQTDQDAQPIDVQPAVLAVPPALEATARSVLRSIELHRSPEADDLAPVANPWESLLELAAEPRLSAAAGGSDTGWYIFANPVTIPAVILSFLGGKETPTIEQIQHTDGHLGIKFRAYLDFGVDLGDPRGATLSTGVAE